MLFLDDISVNNNNPVLFLSSLEYTYGSKPSPMELLDLSELHMAALIGEVDMVESLLQDGGDPNETSLFGKTPMHFVLGLGIPLEEDMLEIPPLENRIRVLKLLIEKGSDVDSKDSSGRTPLMTSIRSIRDDNLDLARILLENGANPLIQDKDGYTCFHHACDFKRPDMLALLNDYGPPAVEFPIGKDRRTLLHLTALCCKGIFRSALELTPVEYINITCASVEGKVLDEMLSLPCCLIQNRDLDGLEALLNKEGISESVVNCPIVSELCRGVYSPVSFAFVKDTFSDFSFRTIQLYVDHNLPLDPDYTEEVKVLSFGEADVLTCLEILVDVHEFHMGNNLANTCTCARLFIILLKKGARLKPYKPSSNDIISSRVLKFLFLYGSIFGLSYLLKYSCFLEPDKLLRSFISILVSSNRISMNKYKKTIIHFLISISNPGDILEIQKEFNHRPRHPALDGIYKCMSYSSVGIPSLKVLSRFAARKQCSVECLNNEMLLTTYLAELPLPKPLISFLQYGELVQHLKTFSDFPSFTIKDVL